MADWDWMVEGIAALEPVARPGELAAYHALSYGWIVGEVVRRSDPRGRTFAEFVHDELVVPAGADDFWMGLPADEDHRVATLSIEQGAGRPQAPLRALAVPSAVDTVPDVFNLPVVRRASIPGAGAIATADSVAKLFAVLANGGEVNGVRLLDQARIR
jgi:CubicO group peptidase (beta-lactamase class C family)